MVSAPSAGSPAPAAAAPAPPAASSAPSADDELVLEVRLGDLILDDAMLGYAHGQGALLPLSVLMSDFDFAITLDPMAATADGWFLREDRHFHLDAGARVAIVDGRSRVIPEGDILVRPDDIYVDAALLAEWFPLGVKLDLAQLAVFITPHQPFPVQERLAREGRRSRLAGGASREAPNYPRLTTPYQALSWPFIDTSLFAGRDSHGQDTQYNYSTYLTGDLAYLTTQLFLAGTQDRSLSSARLIAGRRDAGAGLLGAMKATDFELGDVFAPQIPLVTNQIEGRGAYITNQPLDRPTEYDRTTLRGDLPLGWEVELYRGTALLDTRQSAADGRYEFTDVPLLYGVNTLRLAFYGPQGQKREEVRRMEIGSNLLRPGETLYRLSVNQQDKATIPVGTQPLGNIEKPGELRATAEFERGLTQNLGLAASIATLGLQDGRHTYFDLGARASVLGSFIAVDGSMDQSGNAAARALVETGLGPLSMTAEHNQYFDGFISDRTERVAVPLERRTDLRVDGGASIAFLPHISYSLSGRLDAYRDGQSDFLVNDRLSTYLRGFSLSHDLTYERREGGGQPVSETVQGSLLLSSRFGPIGLRSDLGYDARPSARLRNAGLTLDYSLSRNALARASVVHDFTGSGLTTSALGLFETIGPISVGAAGTYSDDGQYSLGLSASFGLGREPRTGTFAMAPRGMAGDGAVSAEVFLDKDQNGKFSPGDEHLSGVKFVGYDKVETDKAGVAFLPGLSPNRAAPIAIDPSSLEDPYWAPARDGFAVVARPGNVAAAEFAVTATGEIGGKVFLVQSDHRQEIASVELELVDKSGNVVGKTKSEFDGYFSLASIRPGTYRLRVAPAQVTRLRLIVPAEQAVVVGQEGGPISAPDMVLEREAAFASLKAPGVNARVQLAAFSENANIWERWRSIMAAVQDLLAGLEVKIDSGAWSTKTGNIYRLQVGPFTDMAAARSMCAKLKDRGQACFAVQGYGEAKT